MKAKRWISSIISALVILASLPLISIAAAPQLGLSDTIVTCTVDSRFEFALPPSATLTYPNTSVLMGQFTINDLFLESDERLSIELMPGTMTARGTGTVLPYTVTFNPPATVDSANIGDAYDVAVTIDAAAFAATRRPFHDADLLFRVRSLLTGDIIWQGTTRITARKTPPNQGGDTGDDGGDDGGAVIPGTGDNTLPEEQVPQASPGIEVPQGEQPGEIIPAEDVPEARPVWSGWWWWIPVAALAALLLILLLLLWHNVSVRVYGRDSAGQETLIRTIRRLMIRRDEVIISLRNGQIRGGVTGEVELTKAFTRRMRGRRLSVELEGIRLFSTEIPANAEGRFHTRVSWLP